MKTEITYNPKNGYSIYYIDSKGLRTYHGSVSTQAQADAVFEESAVLEMRYNINEIQEEHKTLPSWKKILYPHAFIGHISKMCKYAQQLEYPYFCWNGRIYHTKSQKEYQPKIPTP